MTNKSYFRRIFENVQVIIYRDFWLTLSWQILNKNEPVFIICRYAKIRNARESQKHKVCAFLLLQIIPKRVGSYIYFVIEDKMSDTAIINGIVKTTTIESELTGE